MRDELLLGIDIGTSHVKAALVDAASAKMIATTLRETPLHVPKPGYAEQNPDDWWQAAVATVREVLTAPGINPQHVRGIGLSGQMHGTVCLDASLRPVRSAIIWADQRSAHQVHQILQEVSFDDLARYAPGLPSPSFMGPVMRWLREYEPETLDQTHIVMLPKDYVRLQLTGEAATDTSDASAAWLFDVVNERWSDWLTALCHVELQMLPPVLGSAEIAGVLTGAASEALGLPVGIPVVAGSADCAAQSLGCGVIDPGTALIAIGTGAQVVMPLNTPQPDPALRSYLYNHAVPDRWYVQTALLAAGLMLRWLRDTLGTVHRPDAYEHLSTLAAGIPPGADGLICIPHLAGRRGIGGSDTAGGFVGLRLHHGSAHLARAGMEGVAFAVREILDAAQVRGGVPEHIIASGGAMRSPVWRQILVDVISIPLELAEGENHACSGAALMAGVGCGIYSSLSEACKMLPAPGPGVIPDPARQENYEQLYQRYHQTVEALYGHA
jgi:xylulokinase